MQARVTLYGYFFLPGASAYVGNVQLQGATYLGPEPDPPHRWRLLATFPGGLPAGTYDVSVVNPDGKSARLRNSFTVQTAPTWTPGPTATSPPGSLSLDMLVTTDAEGRSRTAFVMLDTIKLWLHIVNSGQTPLSASVGWEVRMPDGTVLDTLSWSGTVSVDPAAPWWALERSIPTDVPTGEYTLAGWLTYAGQTTTLRSVFYLANDLLRADDFADAASDWPSSDTPQTSYGYLDGQYRIWIKQADWSAWATAGTNGTDVVLETDVLLQGSGHGSGALATSISPDGNERIIFAVSHDGRYGLFARSSGAWQTLAGWSQPGALVARGWNHLMLVRLGPRIRIYANGQFLGESQYAGLRSGRLGLYGEGWTADVDARFDNWRAHRLGALVGK
jgi:hypothetical protein